MEDKLLRDIIMDVLEKHRHAKKSALKDVISLKTFEDADLRLINSGLVIAFKDGTEFQIEIIQSKDLSKNKLTKIYN